MNLCSLAIRLKNLDKCSYRPMEISFSNLFMILISKFYKEWSFDGALSQNLPQQIALNGQSRQISLEQKLDGLFAIKKQ